MWPCRGNIVHFSSYTDCGAGIGRVSKELLLPIFTKVDLVEQNKIFLDNAPDYLVSIVLFIAT